MVSYIPYNYKSVNNCNNNYYYLIAANYIGHHEI